MARGAGAELHPKRAKTDAAIAPILHVQNRKRNKFTDTGRLIVKIPIAA
jgi:hypothetical protein